ncbi:MAG: TetR family transcriptional regulator C-terminal domain-containing protein [Pseudomonadales bacterium]
MTKKTTGHILTAMNKREEKKERLLQLGLAVMQERGYNGTGVKDIVEAAQVPKGSFYTYFESKESFAVEAIECVAQQTFDEAFAVLGQKSAPPLDRLAEFFRAGAEDACDNEFRIGCFMGNMCQEMADSSEVIRLTVKSALGKITGLIADVLDDATANGDIASKQDTAVTAQFLFNAWQGALLRMKAEKSDTSIEAFLAMMPKVLNT